MHGIYRTIKKTVINNYYWALDYAYVAYRQIAGFFRRSEVNAYHDKNRAIAVILIPGVYENWQFMRPIADMLYENGYAVHVIEGLGYNRGTVEEMAAVVNHYVEEQKLKECIIVAHSKGGLVGKYVLMNHNRRGVIKGMVAISTPFSGSRYAWFTPLRTLRIFLPDSPILTSLALNRAVNRSIASIYGVFDPHIPGGCYLEGATNIQLESRGHFRIVNDPAVHMAILSRIRMLCKQLHTTG